MTFHGQASSWTLLLQCNLSVKSLKVCSGTMNRKLKLRVLVMVQERMHVCIHTHTPVLSKIKYLCACKTPESILHHKEYHIVSSHGWPNFQWMNEANVFMMAWKWQEAIISHSLNPLLLRINSHNAERQWTDHSGLFCPAVFQKSSWCSISDSSVLISSFPCVSKGDDHVAKTFRISVCVDQV